MHYSLNRFNNKITLIGSIWKKRSYSPQKYQARTISGIKNPVLFFPAPFSTNKPTRRKGEKKVEIWSERGGSIKWEHKNVFYAV